MGKVYRRVEKRSTKWRKGASPHYSREFVTKPPRRPARRARGAVKERGILEQYVDRLSGEPARRQVRRHRACEVERPLYDPGAKKEYRYEFRFSYRRL